MENQDKLHEQFKSAAEKAESQGFARMEAIWNRVEEKLDHKKQRRIAAWWKYTGMTAVLALFITVGTFLYRENTPTEPQRTPENNVTVIDTQRVKETFEPVKENIGKEAVVVNDETMNHPGLSQDNVVRYDTLANGRNFKPPLPAPQALPFASFEMEEKESRAKAKYYTSSKDFSAKAKTTAPAVADSNTIAFSGTVTDSQGMPIPGVTISDGKGNNVQTDFDGKYTININEGDKLVASYIGMQGNSILGFKSNNNATLQMNDDAVMLESVVVDAYRNTASISNAAITSIAPKSFERTKGFMPPVNGSVANIDEGKVKKHIYEQKSNQGEFRVGGEITNLAQQPATVTPKTIEGRPNAGFIQSLQGQVPGLNVTTGSGQPRANDTVVLIGTKSMSDTIEPLIVVDGVPVNSDYFRKISPNDIVSVDVLKNAAATAIYGNRGANGVIIVKTKNPKATKRHLRKQARIDKRLEKQKQKEQQETGNTKSQ